MKTMEPLAFYYSVFVSGKNYTMNHCCIFVHVVSSRMYICSVLSSRLSVYTYKVRFDTRTSNC